MTNGYDEHPTPVSSFLHNFMATRAAIIKQERDTEDTERSAKLTSYYHAIQNADKLGLTEDDLRVLYNQIGEATGHKADPKLFGLFGIGGDKGSKGTQGLGDMIFPQNRLDQPTQTGTRTFPETPKNIATEAAGRPQPQLDSLGLRTDTNLTGQDILANKIGPPPEVISTRRGAIPISDLQDQAKLKLKLAEDSATTANNIKQIQETAKGQLQVYYETQPDGSQALRAFTYDPIKQKLVPVDLPENLSAVSTANAQAKINKDFQVELNLINEDPSLKDLPPAEKRSIAASRVDAKHKAELAKTQARTEELKASTGLKRARTGDILNPKLTPYQSARLGLDKQRLELEAARVAISEGTFDQSLGKELTSNMKEFFTSREKALKLIAEGNQADAKFKTSKAALDKTTAEGKWREGYAVLASAKLLAEGMKSKFPGMVNVVNTDPNDQTQFPWVETNYDLPAAGTKRRAGAGVGGKRPFTPSPKTSSMSKDQYIEALRGKQLSEEMIKKKVAQYYPNQ